jgi:hypothetical protein
MAHAIAALPPGTKERTNALVKAPRSGEAELTFCQKTPISGDPKLGLRPRYLRCVTATGLKFGGWSRSAHPRTMRAPISETVLDAGRLLVTGELTRRVERREVELPGPVGRLGNLCLMRANFGMTLANDKVTPVP